VVRETTDNFCRVCGHQFTVNLPAVHETRLPARTSGGLPPSVVGSVAVLAAGTALEWLARRLMNSAARAAGRALVSADPLQPPAPRPSASPDVTIDEVLYVRKIEVRR
jgi:hypothetical protein